jgi:hypothetical protein
MPQILWLKNFYTLLSFLALRQPPSEGRLSYSMTREQLFRSVILFSFEHSSPKTGIEFKIPSYVSALVTPGR